MSWKEDDRNRKKRNNIRGFKKQHYLNISRNSKESSSSPRLQVEPQYIRGLVDVADSSDDRFSVGSNQPSLWMNSDDDETNEQIKAGDFELLQQITSDKYWENASTETEKNLENTSYFTLNLNILNAGLQTIPFYKKMDYPTSMFNKLNINRMHQIAEIAERSYQLILNDYEEDTKPDSGKSKKSNSDKSNSAKTVKTTNVIENTPNDDVKIDNDKDELDELLKMTETDNSNLVIEEKKVENGMNDNPANDEQNKTDLPVVTEEVTKGAGEIQEWLDQVLE